MLLWSCWAFLVAKFANQQTTGKSLDYIASGLLGLAWGYLVYLCYPANDWATEVIGATLVLLLPTSKSLDYIALRLLVLSWGDLCEQSNHWIALLWCCWGYLGATFANQQIIG